MNELIARRAMMAQKKGGGGFLGYVEDGLVLMIDGIENSPNGHVDTLTELYDLVGGLRIPVVNEPYPTVYDESFYISNGSKIEGLFDTIPLNDGEITIEFVGKISSRNNSIAVGTGLYSVYENNCTFIVGVAWRGTVDYSDRVKTRAFTWGKTIDLDAIFVNSEKTNQWEGYPYGIGTDKLNRVAFGVNNNTDGNVYSLRIYNRVLTDAEILANYQNDVARFVALQPNLLTINQTDGHRTPVWEGSSPTSILTYNTTGYAAWAAQNIEVPVGAKKVYGEIECYRTVSLCIPSIVFLDGDNNVIDYAFSNNVATTGNAWGVIDGLSIPSGTKSINAQINTGQPSNRQWLVIK